VEVYRKDLARMSPAERKRTLDEMIRAATAHRDREPWLTHLFRTIQSVLQPRRASR
jgi:hypothetical protein